MITIEALRAEIANLVQQRQAAMVTMHQADGAITLARALLDMLQNEEDGIALNDLAQAIGGNGATATIEPVKKEK